MRQADGIGTPSRPDVPVPRRAFGGRTWPVVVLSVAVAAQLFLGLVFFFVGALEGSLVTSVLGPVWVVGMAVLMLMLIQVGRGRWPAPAAWLGILVILLSAAALPVALGPLVQSRACSRARTEVLLSVPPFGGTPVEVAGQGDGMCSYSLTPASPVEDAVSYYERELTRAGWSVRRTREEAEAEGGQRIPVGELIATEGEHTIVVSYEGSDPPSVTVWLQ